MLEEQAIEHLNALTEELGRGAEACALHGTAFSTLLFIMASSEFLSLYLVGSRRPAGARGNRALFRFLSAYFPRFNKDARDERGNLLRVRIPLGEKGGKAFKRLRIPHAMIHLYKRGVLEDLIAPPSAPQRCVVTGVGRWGFQIQVNCLHDDFQEALQRYRAAVMSDPLLEQRYLRRFRHLHGWVASKASVTPS